MSFDITEARKIVISLKAHQRHPGGELMLKAAETLESAINDASTGMAQIRQAEAEAMKHQQAHENALLEIKSLRESDGRGKAALQVVRQIAEAKKGANKIAVDWLATVETAAPAPVEPQA